MNQWIRTAIIVLGILCAVTVGYFSKNKLPVRQDLAPIVTVSCIDSNQGRGAVVEIEGDNKIPVYLSENPLFSDYGASSTIDYMSPFYHSWEWPMDPGLYILNGREGGENGQLLFVRFFFVGMCGQNGQKTLLGGFLF